MVLQIDKEILLMWILHRAFNHHCGPLQLLRSQILQQFQGIEAWDLNKVTKGLFLQPGIQTLWYIFLVSHPLIPSLDFSWDRPIIHDLQHRLEMSEEPT